MDNRRTNDDTDTDNGNNKYKIIIILHYGRKRLSHYCTSEECVDVTA